MSIFAEWCVDVTLALEDWFSDALERLHPPGEVEDFEEWSVGILEAFEEWARFAITSEEPEERFIDVAFAFHDI